MTNKDKEHLEKPLVNLDANTREVVFRHGDAEIIREDEAVRIDGNIDAPARWFEARHHLIDVDRSHIVVDREANSLTLVTNEEKFNRTIIEGRLILNPLLDKFEINSGYYRSAYDLGEFLKMNKFWIGDKAKLASMITALKNLKFKVEKEVEKADNNRGDIRQLKSQIVLETNLPTAFDISAPVYKGFDAELIPVEIYVNADNQSCALVSPELEYIKETIRNKTFDAVIARITAIAEKIAVIEL